MNILLKVRFHKELPVLWPLIWDLKIWSTVCYHLFTYKLYKIRSSGLINQCISNLTLFTSKFEGSHMPQPGKRTNILYTPRFSWFESIDTFMSMTRMPISLAEHKYTSPASVSKLSIFNYSRNIMPYCNYK